MPNTAQIAFLSSAVGSFSILYAASQFFFPGYLPKFNLDTLLGRTPPPPPTTTEKIKMTLEQFMTLDGWKQLYAHTGNDLVAGLVVATVLVGALGIWFGRGGTKSNIVLDPKEYKEFPLVEKIVISPNTALYRFGLPTPDSILGLPIGQHVTVAADIGGKLVARSYTPTSSDDDPGHFDLVIKSYDQGNISKHIGQLKLGDHIRVKGPKGQFRYSPGLVRSFGMIAGGTGITPMYQIITSILYNKADSTRIELIYANVGHEDILLKNELDELAARNKDRFKVYYVLNNPPAQWDGGVGFVSKEMIEKRIPAHSESGESKVLLCGPPPMIAAMKKHLADLKYPAPRTISKLEDSVFCF